MSKNLVLVQDEIDLVKQELVHRLFHQEDIKKYIFGRNESARQLSKVIEFDAFIDDFSNEVEWLEKPVLKSKDIDKDVIVVSCSLAIYPRSAISILKKQRIKYILDYLEVMKYSHSKVLSMPFLERASKDIDHNFRHYQWVYHKITEAKSQKVLIDILNFRKNKNFVYLKDYNVDIKGQYFEDFLYLKKNEVFVDIGGFDGQTSKQFITHCPEYKTIYLFEPSKKNLVVAKKNLKEYKNINFIAQGVSNKKGILAFDPNLGSASTISQNGQNKISVDTLDNLIDEQITFIKMDIEGFELLALEGCKRHIRNSHPKLAISVYHKPDDIWKIPQLVLETRDDYHIFLRHYTEGTDETVMFFIPYNLKENF